MLDYSIILLGILTGLIIYHLLLWVISRNGATLVYSIMTFFFICLLFITNFFGSKYQREWGLDEIIFFYFAFLISLFIFSNQVLKLRDIIHKYRHIQKWTISILLSLFAFSTIFHNTTLYYVVFITGTIMGLMYYYFALKALRYGQENGLIFFVGSTLLSVTVGGYLLLVWNSEIPIGKFKNIVLIIIALSFSFYGSALFKSSNRIIFKRKKDAREVQLARMQALQHRMSPHFLFNSLNTIYSMMQSDTRRAGSALMDLADMYHFLTDEASHRIITIHHEKVFITNFLNIMLSRLGKNLEVIQKWDEPVSSVMIPPLTIQPIIENSFKHNAELPYTLELDITVKSYVDGANIIIRDNGGGMKTKTVRSKTLDNIRERLQYYYHDVSASLSNAKGKPGAVVKIYFSGWVGER
ncbi:MAG: histidine kinase [Leptospirales bacterium]